MTIRIGSNIASLNAQRRLGEADASLSKTFERLASGQRINRASDDAAGLAISSSLNAMSRIFTVAQRNISDTVSAISISSSAVNALTDITVRQRELAEQSANGTFSATQRQAIDKEARELTNEYNRIISTTSFNGIELLANPWDTLATQIGVGGADAQIGYKFADELSTKLTGGSYFILDGADDYYVWFTKDGVGTDPLALDASRGIRVDLYSTPTEYGATAASASLNIPVDVVGESASSLIYFSPGSSFSTGGIGDYFYIGLPDAELNIWYNVDGTNSSPGDAANGSIEVSISAGDSAEDVAAATKAALDAGASYISSTDYMNGSLYFESLFIQFNLNGTQNYSAPVSISNSNGSTAATAGQQLSYGGAGDSFYLMLPSYQKNIWFNVDGSNFNPGDPGGYSVPSLQVNISQSDSQSSVVAAVKAAIEADSGGAVIVTDNLDGTLSFVDSTPGLYSGFSTAAFTSGISISAAQTSNGNDAYSTSNSLTPDTIAASVKAELEASGHFTVSTGTSANELLVTNVLSGLSYTSRDVNTGIVISDSAQASASLSFGDARGMTQTNQVDLSSQSSARSAMDILDQRLSRLSAQQGAYGSIQSRLAIASQVVASSIENFKSAESRIKDADIAFESANLVRTQILQQAATSVLSQANQQPNLALQLLR